MKSAKAKIKATVAAYIKLNPGEYDTFLKGVDAMRHMASDKYATATHAGSPDMRVLFEMPMTLHEMITNTLDLEELQWFKSGGANHKEGGRWFAKTFPAFRVTRDI